MREKGLVSVVPATYNMGGYIAETLDSILGQDHPRVESSLAVFWPRHEISAF